MQSPDSAQFILQAARKFPYLQFAVGALVVFMVLAYTLELKLKTEDLIIGGAAVLVIMFFIVLFRSVSELPKEHFAMPAKILIWFLLFLFMVIATTVTVYAGAKLLGVNPAEIFRTPSPAVPDFATSTPPTTDFPTAKDGKTDVPPQIAGKADVSQSDKSQKLTQAEDCTTVGFTDFSKFPPEFKTEVRCRKP